MSCRCCRQGRACVDDDRPRGLVASGPICRRLGRALPAARPCVVVPKSLARCGSSCGGLLCDMEEIRDPGWGASVGGCYLTGGRLDCRGGGRCGCHVGPPFLFVRLKV